MVGWVWTLKLMLSQPKLKLELELSLAIVLEVLKLLNQLESFEPFTTSSKCVINGEKIT